MEEPKKRRLRSPVLSGLLSLIVPGLGQAVQGQWARGAGLLATVGILAGLILWKGFPLLFVPLAAVWLWGVWDAYRMAQKRPAGTTLPFLFAALIIYVLGAQLTEISFSRLLTNWPAMRPVAEALVQPELLAYPTDDRIGTMPFQVPCIDPLPPPEGRTATESPRLWTDESCAALGDSITLHGEGFFPDMETEIWWQNPIGDYQWVLREGEPLILVTDAEGRFDVTIVVPPNAVALDKLPEPGETQTHNIEVRQAKPYGSLGPTETLNLVIAKIGETIALAFMATVLAVLFAVPTSLFAARNLMWGNVATRVIYYVVRTLLNIIRSIETLIWAIIFGVWVGLGPFAGMLALFFHSVAALGKLYSEAVEGIDPGPIEAVRSTGASWAQVVVYAVLPQFMPSFWAYTLYRWDINVRMATVIGLVCDAGLGFLVTQWIRLGRYNSMATAILAIVLVVAALDYTSAIVRRRVIEGVPTIRVSPDSLLGTIGRTVAGWWRKLIEHRSRAEKFFSSLRRYALPVLLLVIFVLVFAWSWGVSQINFRELVDGAPNGLRLAREMLTPDLITRPTQEVTTTVTLPVPCDVAEPGPAPTGERRVEVSVPCGEVGDPLIITGYGLPPDTRVSVRWLLPDGAYLRIKENCCDTDAQGELRLETTIHPIMEAEPGQPPSQVAISWKEVIGGPEPSEAVKVTVDLAIVTLLMALMATTMASVFSIPLSFFAARNIMGRSVIGRVVYNFFRLLFNLWRSIEPMILVVICAIWVGLGPFAGVLALMLNNIPNLGKLFSETIEEIDPGPVEAVTSTGANRLQTLGYAVVPQLVPRFLAYILYQWDINLRMSVVIGFVGGGGMGTKLLEYVGLGQYDSAATILWTTVAMVWGMDYISAKVRERLT
jgi:phosphonate transport system permease protein